MLSELLNLVYTETCPACNAPLLANEGFICTSCMYHLPRTKYTDMRDNPVARLFWGQVRLAYATSMYHYVIKSRLQNIIHALKYRGNRQAGIELGILLGVELAGTCFTRIDVVVPVPLNTDRLIQRGYNQSALIAEGLSRVLNKPLDCHSCTREKPTGTQTRRNRYERWRNVNGGFSIGDPGRFTGKHVLIVDDVVTTGATLEALAEEFLGIEGVTVSVATVAVADLLK